MHLAQPIQTYWKMQHARNRNLQVILASHILDSFWTGQLVQVLENTVNMCNMYFVILINSLLLCLVCMWTRWCWWCFKHLIYLPSLLAILNLRVDCTTDNCCHDLLSAVEHLLQCQSCPVFDIIIPCSTGLTFSSGPRHYSFNNNCLQSPHKDCLSP